MKHYLTKDLHLVLTDSFPKQYDFKIQDSKIDLSYDIRVISRLLGDDNGKDVLIDFGNHFILVMEKLKASITNFSLE